MHVELQFCMVSSYENVQMTIEISFKNISLNNVQEEQNLFMHKYISLLLCGVHINYKWTVI
jgi:hypothetical protein